MPFITVGSQQVFYAVRGRAAARPVVFLHGAGGSHLVWGNQLEALAHSARPLALDLPGHGRSPGPGRTSIEDYASVVIGFLQDVARAPALLVGHSMGGGIAQTVALLRPDLLRGLVLVGTGARLRVAPGLLDAIESDFPAAVAMVGQFAFAPGAPERAVRRSQRILGQTAPATVHGDFVACDRFDLMSRLPEIKVPALVLCGAEDLLTPPRYAAFLGERIAEARVMVVPRAGHMVMLEEPAVVAQAIIAFLTECP